MGGGGVIYQGIAPQQLEAWARISGNQPNRWELAVLRKMIFAWTGAKNSEESKSGDRHQGLGDYCQDKNIETCRAMFGNALESACSTCPN